MQRNLTPGGDKNGADINLALDALEMAFTHPHINAYVIVGGDSDFLSLVEKLKQYDKKVFVVGGRAFTSVILQRNCHEFIAYENLHRGKPAGRRAAARSRPPPRSPIAQAFPIVRRALKILADREVSPQTGLLKSTLLQLDSTFSERNYGASSFLDFAEKLAAGRPRAAEALGPQRDGGAERSVRRSKPSSRARANRRRTSRRTAPAARRGRAELASRQRTSRCRSAARHERRRRAVAGQILRSATTARWPMYVRNVKQLLRAHAAMAPQAAMAWKARRRWRFRRTAVRVRRPDGSAARVSAGRAVARRARSARRAAVFPGQALQRTEPVQPQHGARSGGRFSPSADGTARSRRVGGEPTSMAESELEPIPIDTTAELLGRAKPQTSRAARLGVGAACGARGTRKAAARKPSAQRPARSRRPAAEDQDSAG